jgi:sterol desaturase/sphingolipid hydroxylase (fatty acid hydroxylase superfamily)
MIDKGISHKPNIHQPQDTNVIENYYGEWHLNVWLSTFTESITMYGLNQIFFNSNVEPIYSNLQQDILLFIPQSFCFEIVFDFFHYITHKYSHENKYLYKITHKKHHYYAHPHKILTFYHSPLDLIITNTIPQFFSLLIIPKISKFQFFIILIHKSYIEISGHTGKQLYPCGSFAQFIWLPRILGIELHSEDHDLHHSSNACNYGKRFSLWDKVFNTYSTRTKLTSISE